MDECGIYRIINKVDGKVYVGSTKDKFKNRWYCHKWELRNNRHYNPHLQNAWNKYGEENFDFQVIEECLGKKLKEKEEFWINETKSYDQKYGYNIERFSSGLKIISEETKRKISENHHDVSLEKNPMFGKNHSKKTKQKISEIAKKFFENIENHPNFGKHLSEKTKQKISESLKGENNPKFGKHLSKETKQKLSKLTYEQVCEIRQKYAKGDVSQNKLSVEYNVTSVCICLIVNNKRWCLDG